MKQKVNKKTQNKTQQAKTNGNRLILKRFKQGRTIKSTSENKKLGTWLYDSLKTALQCASHSHTLTWSHAIAPTNYPE